MKPFENKTKIDPGRLRYTIDFFRQQAIESKGGGSKVSPVYVKSNRAAQFPVNSDGQIEMQVGATILNDDKNFVIRASKNFKPEKDMNVRFEDNYYTIAAITPLDNPLNYYRLTCIRKEGFMEWMEIVLLGNPGYVLGGNGFALSV